MRIVKARTEILLWSWSGSDRGAQIGNKIDGLTGARSGRLVMCDDSV